MTISFKFFLQRSITSLKTLSSTAETDFSLNELPPQGGFIYLGRPNSFQACIIQVHRRLKPNIFGQLWIVKMNVDIFNIKYSESCAMSTRKIDYIAFTGKYSFNEIPLFSWHGRSRNVFAITLFVLMTYSKIHTSHFQNWLEKNIMRKVETTVLRIRITKDFWSCCSKQHLLITIT